MMLSCTKWTCHMTLELYQRECQVVHQVEFWKWFISFALQFIHLGSIPGSSWYLIMNARSKDSNCVILTSACTRERTCSRSSKDNCCLGPYLTAYFKVVCQSLQRSGCWACNVSYEGFNGWFNGIPIYYFCTQDYLIHFFTTSWVLNWGGVLECYIWFSLCSHLLQYYLLLLPILLYLSCRLSHIPYGFSLML